MIRRIALLFPGQAAQQIAMGRLAAERFPQARDVFARVDAALGQPISRLCFEGSAESLQETRWQQPAIFACSQALYQAWRARCDDAAQLVACAAGHSLGEYGALVAADALSLEDGAALVALRGRLMQEAADRHRGGMYAVLGLDRDVVDAVCRAASRPEDGLEETVVLANENAPDQQVISGGLAALERAVAGARAAGARRVLPLKVAGAFHSPLMCPAVEELARAVAIVALNTCTFPVIANSTCEPLREPAAVRAELVRQITAPVRWVESIQTMAAMQPDRWIDCGPGTIVAGLATRIQPGIEVLSLAPLLDAPA